MNPAVDEGILFTVITIGGQVIMKISWTLLLILLLQSQVYADTTVYRSTSSSKVGLEQLPSVRMTPSESKSGGNGAQLPQPHGNLHHRHGASITVADTVKLTIPVEQYTVYQHREQVSLPYGGTYSKTTERVRTKGYHSRYPNSHKVIGQGQYLLQQQE